MSGMQRFEYYLNHVQELLQRSVRKEDPGWWLFTNGLRTPMFMLEALAKFHTKLYDKKIFKKLQEKFKQLEDVLGDIDYYNEYENNYKDSGEVEASILTYFQNKKEKHL
ncbi:MAG TPA: hypothetical protein VK498_03330, partial [Ferruginibacter sp.]|nr:hypothetical protein [Ferruginibacter sp.]